MNPQQNTKQENKPWRAHLAARDLLGKVAAKSPVAEAEEEEAKQGLLEGFLEGYFLVAGIVVHKDSSQGLG